MKFSSIIKKEEALSDLKVKQAYESYEKLILAIEEKNIPEKIKTIIEKEIDELNHFEGNNSELFIKIKKSQITILSILHSELKIVAKNHHRNYWLVMGFTVLGIPLGIAFSYLLDNYGYIGVGLAGGIPVGMLLGKALDKKAAMEGRQLNFDR